MCIHNIYFPKNFMKNIRSLFVSLFLYSSMLMFTAVYGASHGFMLAIHQRQGKIRLSSQCLCGPHYDQTGAQKQPIPADHTTDREGLGSF